jgi:signal transduction histidine kinase
VVKPARTLGDLSRTDGIYGVHEEFVHAFEEATFIVDNNLIVRRANAAAAAFMGCAAVADAIGMDGTVLVRVEDRPRVRKQVLESRYVRDFVGVKAAITLGGEVVPVELRVVPLLPTKDDVDAYVLTVPLLRSSGPSWEEVFRQLGRIAKVAAWIYDVAQDEFTFLIPGSTPGDWTSGELETALRAPETRLDAESAAEWRSAFDLAVEHGQEWNMMWTFLDAGGRRRWLHTLGLAEPQADQPVLLYGVVHDITSTREMQEQLFQAQKMEAIGQLAGGIAHDFNNVLTAISGYRSLIAESLPASHEAQEDLAELARAVHSGAGLVRQLLAFSRKQPIHPVILDAGEVLTAMLTLLRRTMGSNIHVSVQVEAPVKKVLIDRSQLEQVVLNLAINARDAMPQGGTLTLAVRNVLTSAPASGGPSSPFAMDHVEIDVTDTGVGMEMKMLSRIFEPFYTTKDPARGTGLGLPTSLSIVQRAGGFIDVSSRPGAGTSFSVCLPAVRDA